MNKLLFLLLAVVFLSGCGRQFEPKQPQIRDIAVELEPYVSHFETTYNIRVNIPVKFAELQGNTVGLCQMWSNGERVITIDRSFFDIETANAEYDLHIEQVVFHELGHCVLNLDHTDTELSNGWPSSIMYPYSFGYSTQYANNLNYYYNELINNANYLTGVAHACAYKE